MLKSRLLSTLILWAVCVSAAFLPGETAAAQKPTRLPLEIGVFNFHDGSGASYLNAFENTIDRHIATFLLYQDLSDTTFAPFPEGLLNDLLMHDGYNTRVTPMITWQPLMGLEQINAGNYDADISAYAADAAVWGQPLRLRFAHEMIQDDNSETGGWYGWQDQPEEYQAAYQRIVNLFRAQNADLVEFVWCPNHYPFDADIVEKYYPGEEYVDWLCMDGYNWTNQNNQVGVFPDWQSFDQIFAPLYTVFTENTDIYGEKPIMIGEFGSCEAGEYDVPGNTKAGWITETMERLIGDSYPEISAFYWFNADKEGSADPNECDWRVNSSPESEAAFRTAVSDPIFLSHFLLDNRLYLPLTIR